MKMRSLDGKESTFCDILHNAVLQVCREKYWADSPDWEVDGVICISVPHSQEQHVVKIHQKFPSDSNKHFDDRCYECDRKPKDSLSTNETSDRHFSTSVEEEDSSYRNVSVIDLEHASAQPNPTETCGRGTISPNLTSPVREHDQNSQKNFYASPDLSGFGPNVHRQRSEQLKNSNSQSHSKTNNRSKDQEHSSSFTSHSRETTPPRKKAKQAPEEYIVVKAEPDDDEDFALHMECIDEKISENSTDIKDESTQRDLAAETQEDINFLLNVDGSSASHQYNSGDRSWPQRLPTSTVTSQMDTSLSSMAGQGTQGFSNLNLLTHGVDVEDGTMRLTTRVQHPHIIAGQTDSNTPEQRSIPRPSGQDSAAASNTIDKMTELSNVHYLCSWCGRGFKSKSGYYGHIRTHGLNKDAPYKCCGKRFFSLANWNRHRCNRHGEMGKFQCEKCKKRYPSQADLNRHGMLVHSNPEYQCDICGAKFMIKDRLDQHRDTHTGEKRFRCSKCFKPYRHDSNLYKHQKTCSG